MARNGGGAAPQTTGRQTSSSFDAKYEGNFQITQELTELFVVEESGCGQEQTLGAFQFTTRLLQKFYKPEHIPKDCGPFSSFGVGGSAILTFEDGEIRLQRISGTACFEDPKVTLDEQWMITRGTANYVGASGILTRTLYGYTDTWNESGAISGTIRFEE